MRPVEYRNALSKEICDAIIELFGQRDQIYRKRKEYSFKEVMMNNSYELNELQSELVKITELYVNLYKKQHNITIFPQNYGYEAVRVKRYDAVDGDHFPWHADTMDYASARRFLVCMFYLNDNFEGGETDFGSEENIKYTQKPEQGKIVLFSPFWNNPHRGRKLISRSKYIANVYLHLL